MHSSSRRKIELVIACVFFAVSTLAIDINCKFCAKPDYKFSETSYRSVNMSHIRCSIQCLDDIQCHGFNYRATLKSCEFVTDSSSVVEANGVVAYSPMLCSSGK